MVCELKIMYCQEISWYTVYHCRIKHKLSKPKCYYSSAVVRSFQYLWSAVVTILLRTRVSCRHVLVYHMCDLGLQSM